MRPRPEDTGRLRGRRRAFRLSHSESTWPDRRTGAWKLSAEVLKVSLSSSPRAYYEIMRAKSQATVCAVLPRSLAIDDLCMRACAQGNDHPPQEEVRGPEFSDGRTSQTLTRSPQETSTIRRVSHVSVENKVTRRRSRRALPVACRHDSRRSRKKIAARSTPRGKRRLKHNSAAQARDKRSRSTTVFASTGELLDWTITSANEANAPARRTRPSDRFRQALPSLPEAQSPSMARA